MTEYTTSECDAGGRYLHHLQSDGTGRRSKVSKHTFKLLRGIPSHRLLWRPAESLPLCAGTIQIVAKTQCDPEGLTLEPYRCCVWDAVAHAELNVHL